MVLLNLEQVVETANQGFHDLLPAWSQRYGRVTCQIDGLSRLGQHLDTECIEFLGRECLPSTRTMMAVTIRVSSDGHHLIHNQDRSQRPVLYDCLHDRTERWISTFVFMLGSLEPAIADNGRKPDRIALLAPLRILSVFKENRPCTARRSGDAMPVAKHTTGLTRVLDMCSNLIFRLHHVRN